MWLRFLLFLLYMALSVSATGHQHTHSKHSHLHSPHHPHHPHKRASNSSSHDGSSLDEARKLLAAGQAAMAHANRAIFANPRPNRLEVLNATELAKAQKPPPPLDYRKVTASSLKARDSGNGTAKDLRYSVPDELIKAARLLSENWKPSSEDLDGGYAADVQHLKDDFMIKVNDTNMMPPMLQYDSGLVKHVEEPPSAFRYSANESDFNEPAADQDKSLQKRASTDWWMATISQRGSSPFAPSGYQVWRDVKDFGAKGDGVADDTDAINKAISSGGRCGGGKCTGSTIYPATVYFPPGTYKVSSSIIQYYNTEMIGNPHDLPTILAAPSFVGLGVITSNVYTGETSQWYLNTNNFLRSVRNFIIDVRPTPADAQVCGVHWQVAQGTSLENIHFYMTKPKDDPKTTQQGIYMENGSGGFLSDLYFVGGKYGAYMGNQQFTASGLYFEEAETAIQIHWDWGWTMQNIVVDNCKTGFIIVGGAGGPMSTGQGIGSLHMTDLRMHYVKVAVSTSIMSDNSTALLLSNSGFYYVDTIVEDTSKKQVLLPGGPKTINVDTWGFGRVTSADGTTAFHNGAKLDSPVRDPSLVTGDRRQFFTRRRPKYDDLGFSQILDAKGYGAKGDGKTDDTAVLRHLFSAAANMSALVYIPFGVYIITDTVEIPVGSRVIGQAWPQLMATGSKFSDALHPRVAVRVGLPGQVGVVEIQNMMMTVKGATAGAIMMEWNVHESGQGSVGLWDTHFRVGGAAGTDLTVKDCPKLSGKVNKNCVAASLMLHMTPNSSGYFENVWMWTADHDFDTADQTQVDIYVGRGMLVESKGPTWLWGTSVEHCVLYQYQLSGAQNVVMGLIQTEAPYFQSFPEAPAPFTPGAFPDDPVFHDCTSKNSKSCAVAWALRIIDSSAVHVLSAGLYSFFSRYDQTCLKSGRHDCQDKIFYAEQSYDVWVQNLVTLGSIEMVSPLNGVPTLGKPNRNGFASSILAWLGGSKNVTGQRTFKGYRIHSENTIDIGDFPEACQNALTALVRCDDYTAEWTRPSYHGVLPEEVDVDSVCDKGCAQAILDWRLAVDTYCGNSTWHNGAAAGVLGSFISQGINETCQTDKKTGKYCNDIIYDFTLSETIDKMPNNELCSDCYVGRLKMMQASPFSYYNKDSFYKDALEQAVKRCSLSNQPTTAKDSPFPPEPSEPAFCLSDVTYTTKAGDTCDSLALQYSVSSAAIFIGNPGIQDCNDMVEGVKICLPLQCKTYKLEEDDTCMSVADATGLDQGDIRPLNPWVHELCGNLQSATETLGRVICITPPGGKFEHDVNNTSSDPAYSEYADKAVPPPKGATLAEKTTEKCGRWYTVQKGDDCARVLVQHHISLSLFTQANPSVSQDDCTTDLLPGRTYCVGPTKEAFAAEPKPIPYWRFGCFAREADTTNLTVLTLDGINHVKPMSIIACQSYCYQQGWTVWGIQNGDSCFCDNRLRMDSQIIDDSKCNMHCNGNTTNVCGGKDAIEVFADKEMLRVEYESLGCYVHDGNTPVIRGTTGGDTIESPDEMSVDACASLCTVHKGADFFALWEGNLCTCGMTMAPGAKKVSDDRCNVPCTGELGDDCGGRGVAGVYTNKKKYVK